MPVFEVSSPETKLLKLSPQQTTLLFYLGLAIITVAGFWFRLAWIDHPMRYDEAFTTLRFVAPERWFHYDEPNNHVLNTLLMQVSLWVWDFSPAVLRLPAFLFGVLLIPATGWCAYVLSQRKCAGLFAAGFASTSSVLVEYSTNARGYSLVCLAALITVTLSIQLAKNPRAHALWWIWGIAAVAGLYAVPVMLPAVLLSALLMLAQGRAHLRSLLPRLAATLAVVGITVTALYLPVAQNSGWRALLSNRWVRPEPIALLPNNLLGLSRDLMDLSTTDLPLLGKGLLLLGLAGVIAAGLQRRNEAWFLPVLALFVMCIFPVVQRRVPPARANLYLVPLLFVVSSAGLLFCCDYLRKAGRRRIATLFLLSTAAFAWVATAWTCQKRDYLILKEPWECVDAETVVDFAMINRLTSLPNLSIPSNSVSATFHYYSLLHPQFERKHRPALTDPVCERVYLFIWKEDPILDLYAKIPHLAVLFQPPEHVRTFTSTAVYVCRRKSATNKL